MSIEEYVQMLETAGGGIYERFALRAGRGYSPRPHTLARGERNKCFMNAAHLALAGRGDYVEGIGWYGTLRGHMALSHAWIVDHEDKVLDNTWGYHSDAEYVGVRLTRNQLLHRLHETGVYGVFETDRGLDIAYLEKFDPEIRISIQAMKARRHAIMYQIKV